MNYKLMTTVLMTSAIALAGIPFTSQTAVAQEVRFICGESFDRASGQRYPTTFAWTERGKMAVVRWKKQWSGNITPQQRCQSVSPRFQEAYSSGTLNFITNGTANGQPVICTATEQGGACQTMLMTLRAEDNPLQVLNQLRDVLGGRATGPVVHSSGVPQAYYRVDIENFLRTAPVEEDVK